MKDTPTLMDRFILFFSRPTRTARLNSRISVITVEDPDTLCVLKFNYSGDIQYHKLSRGDAQDLVETISGLIDKAP